MNSNLVTEEDLKGWLGFEQRATLEKWLKEKKIAFDYGKGGRIVTTVQALNEARAKQAANADDFTDFDFVNNGTQPSH